jgi:hypothetical protein
MTPSGRHAGLPGAQGAPCGDDLQGELENDRAAGLSFIPGIRRQVSGQLELSHPPRAGKTDENWTTRSDALFRGNMISSCLFEMSTGDLVVVPSSTFANEKILERADLQRLLRARIDAITDDVLIVAEEFGAFADAKRRIDLLGIDRAGRLVVFELKRTLEGGHLELQALRYAAMISTMTSDDLVGRYETNWRPLSRTQPIIRPDDPSRASFPGGQT